MRKITWFTATVLAPLCLLCFTAEARPLAPKAVLGVVRKSPTVPEGIKKSPTADDVAKAVAKAFTALVLHQASQPQPDDGVGEAIARGLARTGRDKLIDSALEDLSPGSKAVERAAVRALVVLALDGKLARDRDRIVGYLRRTNPGMADAVEVTEFLIRLAQMVDARK